jgi:hypothetical protein
MKTKVLLIETDPAIALGLPELTGLKQKSSPNKAQTRFISCKYVAIMVKPLDKTERYSCTKSHMVLQEMYPKVRNALPLATWI